MQTVTLFVFTVLFISCSSSADKWAEIKKTRNIYPTDSISSYNFYLIDSFERRWTNNSYRNYEFKKYCSRNVAFEFETSLPRVRELLSIDSFKIANMVKEALREEGVSHFVGQVLSPDYLSVYFYLEADYFPYSAQDRIGIENAMLIGSDPKWKLYNSLIEKKAIDFRNTK
jgi:hypothetical protein